MHEALDAAAAWYRMRTPFVLVSVVKVHGSAPRLPGIAMAVSAAGEVVGSVSGGCIESAVYEEAMQALEKPVPAILSYGITDADALGVGLTCGGDIDVFVEPVDTVNYPCFLDLADAVSTGKPVAVATVVAGARVGAHVVVQPPAVELGVPPADRMTQAAHAMLASGRTCQVRWNTDDGEHAVFVESFPAAPRLIVFGATDFARALIAAGRLLGYRTTLCDAREVFTTRTRFPEVDDLVVDQPYRYLSSTAVDERTAVCVLTHDPKFDVPLLEVALRGRAGYIGALGSRRTHVDRLRRLRDVRIGAAELERLRSPMGLDLGACTPQETAVSILAEIIASTRKATGRPLSVTAGPIHA